MQRHFRSLAVLVLVCPAVASRAPQAEASVAVFTCEGTVRNQFTSPSVFDDSVRPGVPFSATFQIDCAAADSLDSVPDQWSYYDNVPSHGAYASFGNYNLTPDLNAQAQNGMLGRHLAGGPDKMRWVSANSIGGGLTLATIHASLSDTTGTALTGKGLPPSGPGISDITRWNSATLFVLATNEATGARNGWTGDITCIRTSISPSTVPEPGTLSLLTLAAMPGILAVRRRRIRNL